MGNNRIDKKDWALNIIFITLGSMIYAASVNMLTAPNHIAPGGITGVSTMINYITGLPIGMLSFVINIPIMVWAIVDIGYKFVTKTIFAIVMSSVMIDLFSLFITPYQGDMILVSIFAGVLEGVGLSCTFVRGATTGGTDMIARLIGKRFRHLSMGKIMLALDGVVVVVSGFVFGSLESALYACITIFVCTKLIDVILYGADSGTGKSFFIISPKSEEIGERIMKELDRGVTFIESRGGYSKEHGEMLLCAVRRFEVTKLNRIIREVDKNAFVIVGEAGEISGEGFKPVESDDKPLKELIKNITDKNAEKSIDNKDQMNDMTDDKTGGRHEEN